MGCVECQPLPGVPRRRQTNLPAAPVEVKGPEPMLTTSALLVLKPPLAKGGIGFKGLAGVPKPMHAAVAVLLAMAGSGALFKVALKLSNGQFATVSKETP